MSPLVGGLTAALTTRERGAPGMVRGRNAGRGATPARICPVLGFSQVATPAIAPLSAASRLAGRPRVAPGGAAAIAAGMTARLEHEVRPRRRLDRDDRILIDHHEAAIEHLAHGHAADG